METLDYSQEAVLEVLDLTDERLIKALKKENAELRGRLEHAEVFDSFDSTEHEFYHGEDLVWDALTEAQKSYWIECARKGGI